VFFKVFGELFYIYNMTSEHLEMLASQIMFWGITVFSCMIWWEFYKSRDGRMRVLVLYLFGSKTFIYGGAGLFFLLYDFGYFRDFPQLYLRLILNAPMIVIMVEWYRYIKYKK